jgi:hypothetical protein
MGVLLEFGTQDWLYSCYLGCLSWSRPAASRAAGGRWASGVGRRASGVWRQTRRATGPTTGVQRAGPALARGPRGALRHF